MARIGNKPRLALALTVQSKIETDFFPETLQYGVAGIGRPPSIQNRDSPRKKRYFGEACQRK